MTRRDLDEDRRREDEMFRRIMERCLADTTVREPLWDHSLDLEAALNEPIELGAE